MLAYAEDTIGRRQYTIRFRNLETGEVYADTVPNASGDMAWASDDRSLFYVENDPKTLRSYRVRKHVLGTDAKDDLIAYEEKDESYYTGVHRSSSDQYIVISLSSTESDEQRILRGRCPRRCVPRVRAAPGEVPLSRRAHRDRQGRLALDRAHRLAGAELQADAGGRRRRRRPRRLEAARPARATSVFINDFDLFQNYYVIDERSDGLRRLRVVAVGRQEIVLHRLDRTRVHDVARRQ